MRHSDSFSQLAVALVAAQGQMHAVAKDAVNPHFKSKYASLDVIVETIRPVLAEHGLGVLQGARSDDGQVLTVETMLVHKSGEWIASDVVVPLAKRDPQGAGGALTYGRRYGLSALLNIVSDEDDDGTASRPSAAASKQAPARRAAASEDRGATPAAPPPASPARADDGPKLNGRPVGLMSTDELEALVKDKRSDPRYERHIAAAKRVLETRSVEAKFAAEMQQQIRQQSRVGAP